MIILHSPAKINLTLDILGKNQRIGKHFVNTILYRDDTLFDELELQFNEGKHNTIRCDHPEVPQDESNLVMKALNALNITGWEISIRKNIPVRSGLGGGSSNAGVVLKYFGQQKRIPEIELEHIAIQIGADVPFFLPDDNLGYYEGYGDQLVQSWSIKPLKIAFIETGIQISSSDAYAHLNLNGCGRDSVKSEAFIRLLNTSSSISSQQIMPYIHNDFEHDFFKAHPEWKGKGHLTGSGGMMWKFVT